MKWYECSSCLSEFRVVSDNTDSSVEFCPFCGAEIEDEDLDDEDDLDRFDEY